MTVDFVGIGEAAEILGLSRTSIQKLVDSGQLQAVKTTGGHRRILRGSIEQLNQKMGPKAMLRLAASTQTGSSRDPADAGPKSDHVHILVVEDDAASAAAIVGTFELNYPDVRSVVASDGLDAVLKLERLRPQILITDLNMQPFDGFRLISMVSGRPEYQSVAILVITGMSDADIEERGGLPPNVLLLRKPLSMDRLKGYVDAHVQLLRQQKQS